MLFLFVPFDYYTKIEPLETKSVLTGFAAFSGYFDEWKNVWFFHKMVTPYKNAVTKSTRVATLSVRSLPWLVILMPPQLTPTIVPVLASNNAEPLDP